MIINLLGVGFVLSLDNFRTSVTLGLRRFTWWNSLKISVVFGFFDTVAPLIGILLGEYLRKEIAGPVSDIVGPMVLGLYGTYLIVQAFRTKGGDEELDYRFAVFGLPVPLSLDNLVAGTGLGLVGISPLVPAVLFGLITFGTSLAGLQLGRGISLIVPFRVRWEYVTGFALIAEAIVFGLGLIG